MNSARKCEFCDKRGLPLLLVRDAVAHAGSGAPQSSSLSIKLPSSVAYYTKRLLRSGYVNVFDEARRRWDTYFVTHDGYLFKLCQLRGNASVFPKKPFNCPDEGHRAVASCITIADPLNATRVWIGFSDVLWTDDVRRANEDATYRRRHMAEVDVKSALKQNHKPHRKIVDLTTTIAEYATVSNHAKVNLSWSPFDFNHRQDYADRLKRECEELRPGAGLIVTLPDPAGITQEIAILMRHNAESFVSKRPEDKRKLAASLAIEQIEKAVRQQAEHREINASEQLADEQISQNPLAYWLSDSVRRQNEKQRHLKSGDLRQAAEAEWKKYSNKFHYQKRDAWQKVFAEDLKKFDEEYIAPLALNHVAWMESAELAAYFECNYDTRHAESGAVYTAVVTHCLTATQDKKACADLYDRWLDGSMKDSGNLILRAMVLNQEITAQAVGNAANATFALSQIPWDNIFAAHDKALERFGNAPQDVTAKLMAQLGGPFVKMFNKILDGSKGFRAALMATGLVSGHPVVICEVIGSKKQFREQLIRQLFEASQQNITKKQMRKAINAELKRPQIHGEVLEGTIKRRWVVAFDKELTESAPRDLAMQQRAKLLASSVKTLEELDAINLTRWRTVINQNVRLGVVTAIAQLACLTKLVADEEKSLGNEKFDATGRLYSGCAALAATASEAIGNVLAARVGIGMSFGQGVASTAPTVFRLGGRATGILAGVALAFLDIRKAYNERQEGASGLLVTAYVSSAAIGIGLSAALLSVAALGALAIPVIGILILLMISVSVLIEHLKDNPIQDWLERCPWGRLESERYGDFESEQAQLRLALR